jgi:hypothetical protein
MVAAQMDTGKPYLISFVHDYLLFEFARRHERFPLLNAAGWRGWSESGERKRRKAAVTLVPHPHLDVPFFRLPRLADPHRHL